MMTTKILFILLFLFLTACSPKSPERTLPIALLGTYGYTTYEEFGRTIEDYSDTLDYDSSKLPDTQIGFPLIIPITFSNEGKQTWYDLHAKMLFSITTPDGHLSSLSIPLSDAFVQHRRTDISGQYIIRQQSLPIEFRITPRTRRVFFFETPYIPKLSGVYTVLAELHSENPIETGIARSGFSFTGREVNSTFEITSIVCSSTEICSASQICCSKTISPVDQQQGMCRTSCLADEIEVPFLGEDAD